MLSNKTTIYFCYTYYHLLIATIKALTKNEDSILLINNNKNNALFADKKLQERLKKTNVFKQVILNDAPFHTKDSNLIKYIKIKQKAKIYKQRLQNYNVVIFNDATPIGKILNKAKIKYHLIEDGTDCFKNNQSIINKKKNITNIIKAKLLGMPNMGESKNIIDVEVNDKNINLNQKIIEIPKKELFNRLSKADIGILKYTFNIKDNLTKHSKSSLIITQPFSEDKILKTDSIKKTLYKNIIAKYCENENVILKPHPRDLSDYSDIVPQKNILDKNFPIELLNIINDLEFDKIITVSSTSINLLSRCNNKIILGWNYLDDYKDKK